MRTILKARTLLRLGPVNLLRVASYRLLLKAGFYRLWLPILAPLSGPLLDWPANPAAMALPSGTDAAAWAHRAERVRGGEIPAFSHHWVGTGFPPRWQRSLLTQVEANLPMQHWSRLPDFGLLGGDIKGYWEPARFDGLLILTLGWLCTRREDFRRAIVDWLDSWCLHNPANAGLQWKCGQETGLRLMQLLLAAELLQRWGGVQALPGLATLVSQHVQRIAPTMLYAIGQDNNHGTSEAAAMFMAGAFLVRHGDARQRRQGRRWSATGRRWLEDRLAHLVLPDGSFAQHSVNYHRLLLDTCALAETWRRWYGLSAFSALALDRCRRATRWLLNLTDADSGDAPNLGANDGARLFVLHRAPYRDFRPTVQWAACLFLGQSVYPVGAHDEPLGWLGLDRADGVVSPAPAEAQHWPDGGYAKLVTARAWALLRLPRYRFRPSHCDGLHLDLWLDGCSVLCDGGTGSYNTEPRWLDYFSGTASHNTVQFDARDQMPRVSRFLFGDWLKTYELDFDPDAARVAAAYADASGATHRRTVRLEAGRCRVSDEISGFRQRAVLRWRLAPTGRPWVCSGQTCTDGSLRIAVGSSAPVVRFELVEGWQSLHYAERTALTVLEVEVDSGARLTTDITWPA